MKVVVTGDTGFLGLALARRLLARGELTGPAGRSEEIDELLLFDAVEPPERPAGLDGRVRIESGDVSDRERVRALLDRDDVSVFHLASIVSAGGELDFDAALRVNLDGTRNVLEAARARAGLPRVVFTSTYATFGGAAMPAVVGDTTKLTPQTTYGVTKACGELLVNDYTRKGFLDGRSARLPTVIIRPGKPNPAASSWASGIFREPLNGIDFVLPIEPDTPTPVSGHRTIVANLVDLHEADGAAIGDDRAVNFPNLDATPRTMQEALRRVAGDRPLGRIEERLDPAIQAIVSTWATHATFERAERLGLARPESLDRIVLDYVEDYLER